LKQLRVVGSGENGDDRPQAGGDDDTIY
jgi:hypothetical protein